MKKHIRITILIFLMLTISGCGKKENVVNTEAPDEETISVEEEMPQTAMLYLDMAFEDNDCFQEHPVEVFIDGEEVAVSEGKEYLTSLVERSIGKHVVYFKSDITESSAITIVLEHDMTVQMEIVENEDVIVVGEPQYVDNIDGANLTFPHINEVSVDDAINTLTDTGFVYVSYEASNGNELLNLSDWVVEGVNLNPGSQYDKTEPIVLKCRQVIFQLYYDIDFEANLFFDKYDIELYIDNDKIDIIPHGHTFTKLTKVHEGNHEIFFYKGTDNGVKASKLIDITNDTTVKCKLKGHGGSIDVKDFEMVNAITGINLPVPNVVGVHLDKALSLLGEAGFVNVSYPDEVWVTSNWVVTAQNYGEGDLIDKNEHIELSCMKIDDYANSVLVGLDVATAREKAAEIGYDRIAYADAKTYDDLLDKVNKMTADEQKKWIVSSVIDITWSEPTIKVYISRDETAQAEVHEEPVNGESSEKVVTENATEGTEDKPDSVSGNDFGEIEDEEKEIYYCDDIKANSIINDYNAQYINQITNDKINCVQVKGEYTTTISLGEDNEYLFVVEVYEKKYCYEMRYYGEPSTTNERVFISKVAPLLSYATGMGMSELLKASYDGQFDAEAYKIAYHNQEKEFYGFWNKECTYEFIVMPNYKVPLH